MRIKVALALALGLLGTLPLGDLFLPGASADDLPPQTTKPPETRKTSRRGIVWEDSLELATKRAKAEGKPILFHQLVGDLDKEGC